MKRKFEQEAEERFLTNFGIEYPYKNKIKAKLQIEKGKILVLAVLHEPYSNEKILKDCLQHNDSEEVILAGDIGDFYSKSRFRKTKYVSFRDEVRSIFYRLEWLSINFQSIKIMLGNHDNRPEKKLAEALGDDVDLLALTENNLLKRLASYFDNIQIVGTTLITSDSSYNVDMTHIFQYGDCIFTHAEKSMTQESALMGGISLYLSKWKKELKLKDYKVIAQAHNHTALKQCKGSECWFMIPTCSEKKSIGFDYVYNTRMIGNPPQSGYMLMYQKNGVTDINRTNYFIYE